MSRVGKILSMNKYQLEHALYNALSELHGARHGNIHSPEDFCFENCTQCDEMLGVSRSATHTATELIAKTVTIL